MVISRFCVVLPSTLMGEHGYWGQQKGWLKVISCSGSCLVNLKIVAVHSLIVL